MQGRSVLCGLVAGVLMLDASTLAWPMRLVYNPSESEPIGWYLVRPAIALRPHDLVLSWLPEPAATLADERRYLPRGVPILKEIVALDGQFVCVRKGAVFIDGARLARARERDAAGRALRSWTGCRVLTNDEIFLVARRSDASFDGRYFGPVSRNAVIGVAIPLWTW